MPTWETGCDFARYRDYLILLAKAQVNPYARGKIDLSGIVQQTLLEAHQAGDRLRGKTDAERLGWLRRILAHNLTDEFRKLRTEMRDIRRERPLESDLERSAARLKSILLTDGTTPSQIIREEERATRLATALEALPRMQREAIFLQHWHGWTLAQIAEHLGRTAAAVGGLLKRGLKQLRESLEEDELIV